MFKVRIENKSKGLGVKGIASLLPGPNSVKVGFPAGEADQDVINRAIYNEFGTKGSGKGFRTPRGGGFGGPIPERPFMRNTMRETKAALEAGLAKEGKAVIDQAAAGKSAAQAKRQGLRKLGTLLQGAIQGEITSLSSPANSPVTIAIKGSSNPLIDSGEMRAAVTYKIEE
jgi:hypothetical protein